jgi:hypothetical protein
MVQWLGGWAVREMAANFLGWSANLKPRSRQRDAYLAPASADPASHSPAKRLKQIKMTAATESAAKQANPTIHVSGLDRCRGHRNVLLPHFLA